MTQKRSWFALVSVQMMQPSNSVNDSVEMTLLLSMMKNLKVSPCLLLEEGWKDRKEDGTVEDVGHDHEGVVYCHWPDG